MAATNKPFVYCQRADRSLPSICANGFSAGYRELLLLVVALLDHRSRERAFLGSLIIICRHFQALTNDRSLMSHLTRTGGYYVILERPAKFRRNLASKLTCRPPATQYQREF